MKTFPKPLSIQEEREYLKRYKEGDLEAREVLINRNLRLVAHVIKKYQQTGYDMDDLLSVGTIGLIKAVNTFNVEKGSRLATYAAKCVENEILMMFRSGKKFSREVSIYDPIGADKDGETVSLLDILEAGDREVLETVIIKQDVKILYEAYKENLTEMEQTVIRMRYGLLGQRNTRSGRSRKSSESPGPMCRESKNERWGICGRHFMSFPERPCDTFRRTKIKDCNDIKALASDGGKCFLKFIKKYLHNYTYRVIIMQNYSKNIHDFHPHPGYCPRLA